MVAGGGYCGPHFREVNERIASQADRLVPIDSPASMVGQVLGEIRSWQLWAKERMDELKASGAAIRFTDEKGSEQLRSEVVVYERAMERTVRWLHDLAKLGLEERLVRIEEAKAELVIRCFNEALEAAELPEDTANLLAVNFAQRVREAV